jgi:hypothetical protein
MPEDRELFRAKAVRQYRDWNSLATEDNKAVHLNACEWITAHGIERNAQQ